MNVQSKLKLERETLELRAANIQAMLDLAPERDTANLAMLEYVNGRIESIREIDILMEGLRREVGRGLRERPPMPEYPGLTYYGLDKARGFTDEEMKKKAEKAADHLEKPRVQPKQKRF